MSNSKNTQISLQDAIDWTANWRAKCPNNCKAFSIPIQDLLGVLKEIGVLRVAGNTGLYLIDENTPNGVRAYMAIDPAQQTGGGEKLLLVGTEPLIDAKAGKMVQRDIINGRYDGKGNPVDQAHNGLLGDDEDTGVYDFTEPCPDWCDEDSPLYGG